MGGGSPIKLNVGCGPKLIDGYHNIDIKARPGVIVLDLNNLTEHYEAGSIDEICAIDVIEHFEFMHANKLLGQWCSLLKPGGLLKIATFDFDRIAAELMPAADEKFTMPDYNQLSHDIFGHDKLYDQHKSFWNRKCMSLALESFDMKEVTYKNRGRCYMLVSATK